MSTFKGVIDEFPDIRIDYFRPSKDPYARAPLACFLTHIHSDHLQGLEGFYGGPFIHCSAATKELLLRLERRVHRWNIAKGILEGRKCQYAEKKNKLKVIPMETPTVVELDTERSIRVTLFDANHCPGAVMFLIEGDGKTILYTGDIRAEPWWVDYLVRQPILIPYTTGIKRLDKIYLDTTFLAHEEKNRIFSPKREGIHELIEKVNKYPPDTIFHLNAWTFGYEDVWVALAAAFNTKIHLSKYHFRIFTFIRAPEVYSQGPFLRGYKFGNTDVAGCLTTNPEVRFHSCERRSGCPGLEGKKNIVWITPIVTREAGSDVHEVGSGDLENKDDIELHEGNLQLLLDGLGEDVDPRVKELLQEARNTRKQTLPLLLNEGEDTDELALDNLVSKLSESAKDKGGSNLPRTDPTQDIQITASTGELLPNKIYFPYSRHSSYSELRGLVSVFRPHDIYPCVVDDRSWDETKAMEHLFGDLCEGNTFAHDEEMKKVLEKKQRIQERLEDEEEMYQQQSQERLNREEAEYSSINVQLFKEQLEGGRNLEISGTVKQPTSPIGSDGLESSLRTPKGPTGDGGDITPGVRGPIRGISCVPPPPLPLLATQSSLILLEAARLAGSSTASSSPPGSQGSTTEESQGRAAKRVKRNVDDSEVFNDELETALHTRQSHGEIVSRRGSMDQEGVMEAMEAALEMNGKTWWDVELSCTSGWRYEEETEL